MFEYPDTAEGAVVYGVYGPDLSHQEYEKMTAVLDGSLRAKLKSDRLPVAIHIGPNILWPQEVEFYRGLFAPCGTCCMAFVEPQPAVLSRLGQQLRQNEYFGLNRSEVVLLNAAVCVKSMEGLRMFRLADRICRDFPRKSSCPSALRKSLMRTSMDREYVVREVAKFGAREGLPSLPEERLRSYIEEMVVPCVSPLDLLGRLRVQPADLDMLTIDAEGHDEEILEAFLNLEGFAPAVLRFEWSYSSKGERLLRLVRALASRGYDVHKSQQDLVAIRTRP